MDKLRKPPSQMFQGPHQSKKKPGAGGITAACTLSSSIAMDEQNAEVDENAGFIKRHKLSPPIRQNEGATAGEDENANPSRG